MYAVTEATRAHTVCSDFNRRNPGQTQTTNPEKNLGLYDVPQEDALKGSPSSMRQPQASQGLTFLIPRVKPSNLPHEDLARSMQGHGAPSYIHTHGLFSSPPPHPHLHSRAGLGTAGRQQVPPLYGHPEITLWHRSVTFCRCGKLADSNRRRTWIGSSHAQQTPLSR